MGKHQRRKGNAKTASSAQAAELLASSGHTVPLVTFDDSIPFTEAVLEIREPEGDSFNPQLQIALKKIIKKDALTREKGLKELLCLVNELPVEDIQKSFKHFVASFPKLALDGTVTIRCSAVRVLGSYIINLKKNCEKYLKRLLPYAIFLMHDSYAQVSSESKGMLSKCFPDEKYNIVIDMCVDTVLDICLQIINNTHSLLSKGEGEESDEQRYIRLATQSLHCLKWLCTQSISKAQVTKLLEIFDRTFLKRFWKSSDQIVSGLFKLADSLVATTGEWEAIKKSGVTVAALTRLDNADRGVCRSAASLILRTAKSKEVFNESEIDNILIPRIISLVKRKGNHWNHIAIFFVPLIEAVLAKKTYNKKEEHLLAILRIFFDGMPVNLSFQSSVWMNTFEEFVDFGIRLIVNECTENLNTKVKLFMEKVLQAMKYTLIWQESPVTEKAVHLSEKVISISKTHPEIICQLRVQVQEYLLDGLPATEPLIEGLFREKMNPEYSDLLEQLLQNASVNPKLIAYLLEKCDNDLLVNINCRVSLCQAVSSRIDHKMGDGDDVSLNLLKQLIKFATMFNQQISNFYKINDNLAAIQFLNAYELTDEKDRRSGTEYINHKQILEDVIRYCISKKDEKHWDILMDIAHSFPTFEPTLFKVLEDNNSKIDQKLLISLLSKQGQKICEKIRKELVEIVFGYLFEEKPSSKTIISSVEAIISSEITMNFVAQLFISKIHSAHFPTFGFETAVTAASLFPSLSVTYFVLTYADLIEKFSALDLQYGLEILDTMEFLASSTAQKSLSFKGDGSDISLLSHLNYAAFVVTQLNAIPEEHIGNTVPTLLYSLGVFSLASLNTIKNEELGDAINRLEAFVSLKVLKNENLKERLLSEGISLIGKSNGSLCLLLVLRTLADDIICQEIKEAILLDSSHCLNQSETTLCHVALRLKGPEYNETPTSMNQWTARFELATSWQEADSPLELLSQFMVEGRSVLEDFLFTYSDGTENDLEQNIFNCALIRFLTRNCQYITQMDGPTRDFIFCGLFTTIESSDTLTLNISIWSKCNSRLFIMFNRMSVTFFNECARVIDGISNDVAYAPIREDWSNFFCPSALKIMLKWFLALASSGTDNKTMAFQNALCLSMKYVTDDCIRTAPLPHIFDSQLDFLGYDECLQSILIPLQTLISSSSLIVQITALMLMKIITLDLLKAQNNCNEENDNDDEKLPKRCHQKQLPIMFTEILMNDVRENSIIPSKLLIWDTLISSLGYFEQRERVNYCNAMSPYMDQIIPQLFAYLPSSDEYVNASSIDEILSSLDITKREYSQKMESVIPRYTFRLFYNTCKNIPALVRQWYIKIPRAASTIFSGYVTKFISPLIWKSECDQFSSHTMPKKLRASCMDGKEVDGTSAEQNSKVRLFRSVRQISAEYDLDDSVMTLSIEFPIDYPLSVPVIENDKAIVSRETKRKWLMQLTMFLTQQNGSIVDAVLMWASNIEKHMDGAEDCTICMMTVHTNTYQLPRVRCKQCKKRFHSDCLYKWFDSSNQSTCPLCRASFR